MGLFDGPSNGGKIGDAVGRVIAGQKEPLGTGVLESISDARNRVNGFGKETGPHGEDGSYNPLTALFGKKWL